MKWCVLRCRCTPERKGVEVLANKTGLAQKAGGLLSDLKVYWKIPMPGRYMTFKEIAAYAGGGIGAYFLIYMGGQLAVNINNMIVGGAIGLSPTHMYILYVICNTVKYPSDRNQSEYD